MAARPWGEMEKSWLIVSADNFLKATPRSERKKSPVEKFLYMTNYLKKKGFLRSLEEVTEFYNSYIKELILTEKKERLKREKATGNYSQSSTKESSLKPLHCDVDENRSESKEDTLPCTKLPKTVKTVKKTKQKDNIVEVSTIPVKSDCDDNETNIEPINLTIREQRPTKTAETITKDFANNSCIVNDNKMLNGNNNAKENNNTINYFTVQNKTLIQTKSEENVKNVFPTNEESNADNIYENKKADLANNTCRFNSKKFELICNIKEKEKNLGRVDQCVPTKCEIDKHKIDTSFSALHGVGSFTVSDKEETGATKAIEIDIKEKLKTNPKKTRQRRNANCLCNEKICICNFSTSKAETQINTRKTNAEVLPSKSENHCDRIVKTAIQDSIAKETPTEGNPQSEFAIPVVVSGPDKYEQKRTVKKKIPSENRQNYMRQRRAKMQKYRREKARWQNTQIEQDPRFWAPYSSPLPWSSDPTNNYDDASYSNKDYNMEFEEELPAHSAAPCVSEVKYVPAHSAAPCVSEVKYVDLQYQTLPSSNISPTKDYYATNERQSMEDQKPEKGNSKLNMLYYRDDELDVDSVKENTTPQSPPRCNVQVVRQMMNKDPMEEVHFHPNPCPALASSQEQPPLIASTGDANIMENHNLTKPVLKTYANSRKILRKNLWTNRKVRGYSGYSAYELRRTIFNIRMDVLKIHKNFFLLRKFIIKKLHTLTNPIN